MSTYVVHKIMQTIGKLTYSDYEFTIISTMSSAISSSRSDEIDKCKEKNWELISYTKLRNSDTYVHALLTHYMNFHLLWRRVGEKRRGRKEGGE